MTTKNKNVHFINVEFLAELLYWIVFNCTGVSNRDTTHYTILILFILVTMSIKIPRRLNMMSRIKLIKNKLIGCNVRPKLITCGLLLSINGVLLFINDLFFT